MTGYNHVAIGVIAAVTIKNPIVVIPIAFSSHFLLDALPHYGQDKRIKKWSNKFLYLLATDAGLCFAVLLFALYKWPALWLPIVLGSFFAALPDFMWLVYYKKPLPNNWFYRFSAWIQWGERPWGFFVEIPFFIIAMFILISLQA